MCFTSLSIHLLLDIQVHVVAVQSDSVHSYANIIFEFHFCVRVELLGCNASSSFSFLRGFHSVFYKS